MEKCSVCGFPFDREGQVDGMHPWCAAHVARQAKGELRRCSNQPSCTSIVSASTLDAEGRCTWCVNEASRREGVRATRHTSGPKDAA